MNEIVVYWIVLGCLAFSAVYSIVEDFILIRKSDSTEKSNRLWCGLVNDICVYGIFISLYATRYFVEIYEYIYYGHHLRFMSEFIFILIILLIWIAARIPFDLLNVITSPKSMSTMKEKLKDMLLQIPLVLLFGGYIILVAAGIIWALIPAVFAVLAVIVIMLDNAYKYRNIITVKLILWVSVVSITLLGIGLIAYDLTSGYIFSAAMDIYPASYAANLLSLIFVALPLIRIAEPFYKKYEPQLYIPMVKEDIEALEANKREKKREGNKEEDNNERQQ
ncbi:MAG: hypothetical protein ACLS71_17010 [Parabacteroides distasonis]